MHGVAASPIAGCGEGSERGCQFCVRAAQVKVLKGICRVTVREQRCAAEESEIQRQEIPQADGFVPCSCGFIVASHTYSLHVVRVCLDACKFHICKCLCLHVSLFLLSLENIRILQKYTE